MIAHVLLFQHHYSFFPKIIFWYKSTVKNISKKCLFRFSRNHVFPTSILVILPSTMFFRKFFFPFDRACKDAGHDVLRFLKKNFFMSEKCRLQNLHAIFWPFFMDFYLCKIFRLINGFWKKNPRTSCTTSSHALSNGKKKNSEKHSWRQNN